MTYGIDNPNTFFDQRPKNLKKQLDSSFKESKTSKDQPTFFDDSFKTSETISDFIPPNQNKIRNKIDLIINRLANKELPGHGQVASYLLEKYRKNHKLNTIRNNAQALELFLGFVKQDGKTNVEQISKDDIAGFVESQQDQDLKIVTVNSTSQYSYAP